MGSVGEVIASATGIFDTATVSAGQMLLGKGMLQLPSFACAGEMYMLLKVSRYWAISTALIIA